MRKGIRDLKMGLLPNDDFNHTWRSFDSYGLTGTQLENKLAVGNDIKKSFDNLKDNFLDTIKSSWFSDALDFLTTFLGSIGKVLLKEYIEQLLELINTVKYIIKKP